MLESLKHKTILVTGASSGIGRTTAILLSLYCDNIIITARREKELNDTLLMMKKGQSPSDCCRFKTNFRD